MPTVPVTPTPGGTVEECQVDLLSPPRAYGNKVKTLLTGHALTAEELATLDEDPAALRDMVAGWFDTPEAEISLRHFFEMSFQQNQVANDGLMDMLNTNNLNWGVVEATRETTTTLLIKNIEESFARTALQLVKDGRPFNDVVTTGATATESVRVLQACGAEVVAVLALAHA